MIIPAFTGELGFKLRHHVPYAYALGPGHTVECEQGEEALYPLAAEYRYIERPPDDTRRKPGRQLGPEKFFTPEPHVRQNISADVVICPRARRYGASKNWNHWDYLAELPGVFAAGAPDSSADVNCPRAWDYSRFLDASIDALRSARLCIATANGLSVLAMLTGTPLLLITHRGLVAPGAQLDPNGRILQRTYGPVSDLMRRFYNPTNHRRVPIRQVDGWESPERVWDAALDMLEVAA